MTESKLRKLFEEYSETSSCLDFDQIENKRSKRTDLHVFLLLDSLLPASTDIIESAEHDVIYLQASVEELAKVITEDQVLELVKCGVMIDDDSDLLAMFV